MGVVYRAYEAALDRTIALKVLAPELANQPGFVARLRREAISAARLRHPNIALLYEFGQADDTAFLAMEYLPGRSLRQLLEAGPPPAERALSILDQIGQALDYAHSMGIVHRDVKPSNILVSPADQAMLIDFGLAEVSECTLLTADSAVLGTPHYMAPEQAAGRGVGERGEQYALAAVVLFAALLARGNTGSVALRDSGRAAARSGVPLPRQIIWTHTGEPNLIGGPALVAANGTLVIGTLDGQVLGVDAGSGELRWRKGGGPSPFGAPSAGDGLVFVGTSDGFVQGLSLSSGNPTWKTKVVGIAQQPPTLDGDRLIVTTDKGYISMLQAGNGQLIWDRPLAQSTQPPIASDGRIFVSAGTKLFALDARDGAVDWSFDAPSPITTRPVIAGDMVVVGSERGLLYALQIADGELHLRYQASGALIAAPAAGSNALYVADQSGAVTAISPISASVLWRFEAGSAILAAPLLADGKLLFGAANGMFYVLDARNGQQLARIQLGGSVVAPPALGDGLIFVRADKIYALGE
jgi:outer membrane protein assembly factor BamB